MSIGASVGGASSSCRMARILGTAEQSAVEDTDDAALVLDRMGREPTGVRRVRHLPEDGAAAATFRVCAVHLLLVAAPRRDQEHGAWRDLRDELAERRRRRR